MQATEFECLCCANFHAQTKFRPRGLSKWIVATSNSDSWAVRVAAARGVNPHRLRCRNPLKPSGTSNCAPKTTELSEISRMRGFGPSNPLRQKLAQKIAPECLRTRHRLELEHFPRGACHGAFPGIVRNTPSRNHARGTYTRWRLYRQVDVSRSFLD